MGVLAGDMSGQRKIIVEEARWELSEVCHCGRQLSLRMKLLLVVVELVLRPLI